MAIDEAKLQRRLVELGVHILQIDQSQVSIDAKAKKIN